MKHYALGASQRIRSSHDFGKVYEARQRAADSYLLVYAIGNSLETTRFGVSVSRKVGKAVVRTAVKRRLREAFRLSQHDLPAGLDLILIPQRQTAGTAGLDDYRKSLIELTRRLARRAAVSER